MARWTNFHGNLPTVSPDEIRVPSNGTQCNGTFGPVQAGLQAYEQLVQQANASPSPVRVRPFGGVWSLSSAAIPEEWGVNTNNTVCIVPLGGDLVFVQCGAGVGQVHDRLWKDDLQLALPTSGASDGQTIAGAVATGTHGSAFEVGSMADHVVALHIVTPSRTVWLDSSSDPVVTDQLMGALPGQLIRDDCIFHAALVSFGAFGIVHGLVLRCVPRFKLRVRSSKHSDADVFRRQFLNLTDAASIDRLYRHFYPAATAPFHFEVLFNPYKNEAYVRAMERVSPNEPSTIVSEPGGISADAISVIARIQGLGTKPVGESVRLGIEADLPDPNPGVGSPHEVFGPTGQFPSQKRRQGLSTEIGLPPQRLNDFLDIAIPIAKRRRFLGSYAVRYVKRSKATLGWTCFDPMTCTVETPMILNDAAHRALEDLWAALKASQIPHTFHWGQCLPVQWKVVDRDQVLHQYQISGAFQRWKTARADFLDDTERRMFSNRFTDALGL